MNKKEEFWLSELVKVGNLLDESNISYFLDHGTLLGAVREKGFIPWDNDIDLGVVNFEINKKFNVLKKLISKFHKLGFSCKFFGDTLFLFKRDVEIGIKFYSYNDRSYSGYFIDYKEFNIYSVLYLIVNYRFYYKVNFFSKIKNFIYASRTIKIFLKPFEKLFLKKSNLDFVFLNVSKNYFEKLSAIKFYHKKFPIPSDTKNYLSFKYGSTWEKPKKNYNYLKEDGAII